ncbi:hypothetical protein CR513_59114, partial [Mucuna pruriens]
NVKTFRDDEEIAKEDVISLQILKAIESLSYIMSSKRLLNLKKSWNDKFFQVRLLRKLREIRKKIFERTTKRCEAGELP